MTSSAARHLLNPLASAEQVKNTPSRQDELSRQLETNMRTYGCLLIQQAGIHLKAPQVLMTTASVLFQRFFYVSSMRSFSVKDIAAAALFLASKLEEHPIRIRDLINCFDYLIRLVDYEAQQIELERISGTPIASSSVQNFKYKPMDYFAKEYYDWKDDIVIAESQILKRLGFNTVVQNPYGSIVNYLQVLNLTDHPEVTQRAWSFANDFLLTPLLATHPPHLISVACVYLAVLVSRPQVVLPMEPAPWFTLFDVATEEEIWQACKVLLEVYQTWSGSTDWLVESETSAADGAINKPLVERLSIWRRAAQLDLPLTKAEVRAIVDKT
ncbi:cyclin-like protein [Cystobasidium minutum MCA 4210]|uniref:cyclin-like protein n=1 Tax=Cystobasidium minutum MCA 4210 TaxID=1397322 RepID=UPI0034CF145A|eukprot:jgi/Rhomi1/170417/fgenesh1_kg.4_\